MAETHDVPLLRGEEISQRSRNPRRIAGIVAGVASLCGVGYLSSVISSSYIKSQSVEPSVVFLEQPLGVGISLAKKQNPMLQKSGKITSAFACRKSAFNEVVVQADGTSKILVYGGVSDQGGTANHYGRALNDLVTISVGSDDDDIDPSVKFFSFGGFFSPLFGRSDSSSSTSSSDESSSTSTNTTTTSATTEEPPSLAASNSTASTEDRADGTEIDDVVDSLAAELDDSDNDKHDKHGSKDGVGDSKDHSKGNRTITVVSEDSSQGIKVSNVQECALPIGRYNGCSFAHESNFYVFGGGIGQLGVSNELWRFDKKLKPCRVFGNGVINGKGRSVQQNKTRLGATMECFKDTSAGFFTREENPNKHLEYQLHRRAAVCAAYNGRAYIFGGRHPVENDSNGIWSLPLPEGDGSVPAREETIELPKDSTQPGLLQGACGGIYNGGVYIHGGRNHLHSKDYSNQLWRWDIQGKYWLQVGASGAMPKNRNHHGCKVDHKNGILYIFGGRTARQKSALLSDLWSYNLNKNLWTRLGGADKHNQWPSARFLPTFVHDGNVLYILGGQDEDGNRLNDAWKFDLSTMKMERENKASCPRLKKRGDGDCF